MWIIVLNHTHNDLWRREGELVGACDDMWNSPFFCLPSIFFPSLLNHKLCERHPVIISFSQGVQSHILHQSCFFPIHLSIIGLFIHTSFPLISSFYFLHTNSLFHPSFSSPFKWNLDSHLFSKEHIASAWQHISCTQHSVLADSPRVCHPLHLFSSIHPSALSLPVSYLLPLFLSASPTLQVCFISSVFLSGQLASMKSHCTEICIQSWGWMKEMLREGWNS